MVRNTRLRITEIVRILMVVLGCHGICFGQECYSQDFDGVGCPTEGNLPSFYQGGDTYYEDGCEPVDLGATLDAYTSLLRKPCWSGGIEFTLLRPHFENNAAFTTLDSDGDTFENFSESQFSYGLELSPRIWIEALATESLGFRAVDWQFDHGAAQAVGTPPANGFGRISPQPFGSIDLSTTVPGSQFTADSDINAFSLDLEFTKCRTWGRCGVLTSVGVRVAELDQRYIGSLQDETGTQTGSLNFLHDFQGIGPTISVRTQRPLTNQLSVFGIARGSLVFGEGSSSLTAVEDLDLDDQLSTSITSTRDDLLPIGEVQLGVQWSPMLIGQLAPYVHAAFE
ncbi:MAG: Lpg1974 family pore-forming outer membrane protein, partial [Planctomycetota bacterium]